MSIEVEIPKELEFKIKAKREPDALVKRRIERQISTDIKMMYSSPWSAMNFLRTANSTI